jgi:hypothetical protein
LLRTRINWNNKASLVPFFCVCILFFGLPSFTDNTALLYERFSLFILPTFAWIFCSQPVTQSKNNKKSLLISNLAVLSIILACVFTLGLVSMRAWRFGQETQEFDALVRTLKPNERALALIYYPKSLAADNAIVYLHYAAWYQAEVNGVTDFNFAWYTPQIVRYRPTHRPTVTIGFEWVPKSFDWKLNNGKDYRYFFVRAKSYNAQDIFQGADCMPKPVVRNELWTIFESCTAPTDKEPRIQAINATP